MQGNKTNTCTEVIFIIGNLAVTYVYYSFVLKVYSRIEKNVSKTFMIERGKIKICNVKNISVYGIKDWRNIYQY